MNNINIKNNEVAVYGVGGLGEIGKNTYGIQFQDEIIMVDAGIKFPENELLGVNYVIPDYQYLVKNKSKIKALVITHAHEDHIGGVPYLLKQLNIPIYAGPLAIAMIKEKLDEHGLLKHAHLHEVEPNSVLNFGKMSVTFFRTTHSIPDSLGIAVHTPQGIVVESGDYKFDLTPITNQSPDFQEIAHLGQEGVLCLMSDSTNAEQPGWTESERWVGHSIRHVFANTKGRLIFATFASNISRIKQAADTAVAHGRKIAIFGRSMEGAIANGQSLGYLNIPTNSLITADQLRTTPKSKTLILCTGSQGEQMAALSRMARGTHRQIKIHSDDTVFFSSNPIPGNTVSVNTVINQLEEDGAHVIHGKINHVHTSGHGRQNEQKLMVRLTTPKYFMPIHGECRMLHIHNQSAEQAGVPKKNCFALQNGDVLAMTKDHARIAGHFEAGDVYVEDNGIGTVGTSTLHERQVLSKEGLVAVVATLNLKKHRIEAGPDLLSRGFVYMRQSGRLLNLGRHTAFNAIRKAMNQPGISKQQIEKQVIQQLGHLFYQQTKRHPLILPMLVMHN